jgi:hypothetical protein
MINDMSILLVTSIPVCIGVLTIVGCAIRRNCVKDRVSDKYFVNIDNTQKAEMYTVPIIPYPVSPYPPAYSPAYSLQYLKETEYMYPSYQPQI